MPLTGRSTSHDGAGTLPEERIRKEVRFLVPLVEDPNTALVPFLHLSDQPPLLRPPKRGSSQPAHAPRTTGAACTVFTIGESAQNPDR